MRIVLDTNILARAHQLAHGPARQVLLHVVTGSEVLILSQHLLQELERILSYPRLLKRSEMTAFDISDIWNISPALLLSLIPSLFPRTCSEMQRTIPFSAQPSQGRQMLYALATPISSLKMYNASARRGAFES